MAVLFRTAGEATLSAHLTVLTAEAQCAAAMAKV